MADNTVRGRFVWHELYTPNGDGAHEFYSKTVGWKTQGWEQNPSYRMFAAPTGPLGATVEARDGVPEWVPYIGTTDVDATVETAKRLGAKVTKEPETLPNAGRYAVLTDPNGATFGVHGSAGEPRPETDPQYGEFCWHELATTVGPVEAFAVLPGAVRLGRARPTRHGPDRHLSSVRPQRQAARRNVQEGRAGQARTGVLGRLRADEGRRQDGRRREGRARPGLERPDGRTGRRSHRAVRGSARRVLRGSHARARREGRAGEEGRERSGAETRRGEAGEVRRRSRAKPAAAAAPKPVPAKPAAVRRRSRSREAREAVRKPAAKVAKAAKAKPKKAAKKKAAKKAAGKVAKKKTAKRRRARRK